MPKFRKFFSTIVFCGIAAALPASFSAAEEKKQQAEAPAANAPNDTTLALVSGTPITRADVDRAIKAYLAQSGAAQPTPDQLKQLKDVMLDQMIAAEILYQSGLKIAPKDLDQQVDTRISEGRKKFRDQADFENALKASGIQENELKELTRKDLVIKNFIKEQIEPKAALSEKEVEKFYNDNIQKFIKPEQVRASHILVKVETKTDEDKKKAREKAEDLLKRAKAGEDFAALAKANSNCPSSAQGGDLGLFGKGQMVPPFETAAFALKPGELSNVVETDFGYHIIKLTDKQEAGTAKLSEVRKQIEEYLKPQKLQKAVSDYLQEQKPKMKIEKLAEKK